MPSPEIADVFFAELTSRIDAGQLYPPFAALLRQLLANLEHRGSRFYATSGFRSVEEQDALYAKGRTTGELGHVVTKARGGFSAHNWACGTDLCHDLDVNRPGLQPDYAAPSYDVLGEEAAKLGLEWGGGWTTIQDRPHIQLPLKAHGIGWEELLKLNAKGGLAAAWKRLDRESWAPVVQSDEILTYGPSADDAGPA